MSWLSDFFGFTNSVPTPPPAPTPVVAEPLPALPTLAIILPPNATASLVAVALVKKSEGCSLKAYPDVNGVWTVGYGCQHLNGVPIVKDQIISQAQADAELLLELEQVAKFVTSIVTLQLTQNQLDALCDFTFNCGSAAFTGSSLRKAINAKSIVSEDLFTRWNKIHNKQNQVVVLDDLTVRRKAEYALYSS